MYLLVNDGAGGFTEEAVARGAALARDARLPPGEGGLTSSFSVAVGDFDNDGWLDLFTTEWFPRQHLLQNATGMGSAREVDAATTSKLLRNLGGSAGRPGCFEDATWAAGIRARPRSYKQTLRSWMEPAHQQRLRERLRAAGVASAPEAELKLAELNARAARLFPASDELDQQMAEVVKALKAAPRPTSAPFRTALQTFFPYVGVFTFAARFVDLTGDGWPELVISGDFGTTQLWYNRGDGTFEEGCEAYRLPRARRRVPLAHTHTCIRTLTTRSHTLASFPSPRSRPRSPRPAVGRL
jgi:hypothetical protein